MNSRQNPGSLPENRTEKPEKKSKSAAERKREDDQVESALYRRAIGYEDAAGKEIPPDIRAALFWLKNRRPKEWGGEGKRGKNDPPDPEITLSESETSL